MAKLPNGERAIIDARKLTSYALDATHDKGKHKARVFAAALDATLDDAALIVAALRDAALNQSAQSLPASPFGAQ